ncbi:MAG: apolipoprotein N-acyltransferase [Desulfobulbaceae bacterium]|nr:apolipoprotein N-acyltransferase [Desulfobulbaceae bacterium]HIJ78083.1 apolipoprotein N-acyltransferase [Deltaproteobacteria bacterium]
MREWPSSWAAALTTSLLLFLASPGTFSFSPLAWVALIPLLWAVNNCSVKKAALLGLLSGLLYYLPLLHWIITVLATFGQVPLPLAILALILLAAYMSCYLALFTGLCRLVAPKIPLLCSAPFFWVALDFVRSKLFTGFPWLDLGYSQYDAPGLIQVADLVGHHGVSFLIVTANVLLMLGAAAVYQKKIAQPRTMGAALLLLIAAAGYNLHQLRTIPSLLAQAEKFRVAVVQANIPQDQKWLAASQKQTVESYLELSRLALAQNGATDLIVWPETALPFYPQEHALSLLLQTGLAHPHQVAILTGAPHRERAAATAPIRYYNSAFLVSPDGRMGERYDKQHLVPFGEYIPFRQLLAFASPVVETMGDFSPGAFHKPLSCQNSRIGVLICFESIFPELSREQVSKGANLLVIITNDAWFGRTSAPYQHLAMAVFRAVENRRSVARAANTGISGFIEPSGQLQAASPLFKPYTAGRKMPLLGLTTFYVDKGYLFPYLCLLLTASCLLWRILTGKPEPKNNV